MARRWPTFSPTFPGASWAEMTIEDRATPGSAPKRSAGRVKVDPRLRQLADRLRQTPGIKGQAAPKYLVLHEAVLDAIESGVWKPGERLPSEADLADILPVSLGTVQRALQTLVEQGVVTRRHGQGSFVAGLPVNANHIRNFRFLDDDGESLLPVYGRVLDVELSDGKGPWSDFLGADNRFVRISRVISVNLEFQTYSLVYLPEDKFGDLLKMPRSSISVPLTYMLSERFNAPTLHATHTVSCAQLPQDACLAMGQQSGSIGMHWEIFSFTYRKLPSFYQRVYLPLTARKLQFSDLP